MIKHVGKHNNRKVVILYRTIPGENHMCLIAYPDTMPRHIHDGLMEALESPSGQDSKELNEYLFRHTLADGRNTLQTLHVEGMIKKVPTNQVIVTPTTKSSVRLDELNTILDKMAQGEEAVKELAELDKNAGLTGKKRVNKDVSEVRTPQGSRSQPVNIDTSININEVLSDTQLAAQRQAQAAKMIAEANMLLAEAERLQQEATELDGSTNKNVKTTRAKKAKSQKTES
jgi:hypothetical protein